MTIRQVLIKSTAEWLYSHYPDDLPETEIKPALKMCADMLFRSRDVRRANDYLDTLSVRWERALIADVRAAWQQKRIEDTAFFSEPPKP